MKTNRFMIQVIFLMIFVSHSFSGQEIISSSGDFHTSGSHSVSWTIGEPVIETYGQGGTVMTQGFQQPILFTVSVYEHPELNLDISAFPNPTSDILNIVLINSDYEKLSLQLFDFTGKLLESRQIVSENTEIMFAKLPVAVYFVKISYGLRELKTFKVVKQ